MKIIQINTVTDLIMVDNQGDGDFSHRRNLIQFALTDDGRIYRRIQDYDQDGFGEWEDTTDNLPT